MSSGEKGDPGFWGDPGPSGIPGENGNPGLMGFKGAQGDEGQGLWVFCQVLLFSVSLLSLRDLLFKVQRFVLFLVQC